MAKKSYAEVDRSRCVACGVCMKECPKGAVHIWHGCYAVIDKAICVGCGKCTRVCPAVCISKKNLESGISKKNPAVDISKESPEVTA